VDAVADDQGQIAESSGIVWLGTHAVSTVSAMDRNEDSLKP
jgi:hypothetical protein